MRLEELRAALRQKPFDAMLLTGEINRRYATGFPSSAGVVYLSEKQAVFFTDFRYIEAAQNTVKGFKVEDPGKRSYSACINPLLEQDGVKTIGLEDHTLTHDTFLRWSDALHAEACTLGDTVEQLRRVKDEAEVTAIVSAQRIAERAFEEVLNDIKPDVTEQEIAARLTYLMLHYGAENMSFDPIVVSGKNSSKPHGVPSQKKIADGDFVTMDFGCILDGYCSDMTRTIAVGHVTEEMEKIYHIVLDAQLAGIAKAKAGVTGAEVDGAARRLIEQAGYGSAFGHGFGHSVGLEIHESPNASPAGKDALPDGCVLTAEPGIYLPDQFGVRIEDMLYIIADGCINLTEAPKNLIVL